MNKSNFDKLFPLLTKVSWEIEFTNVILTINKRCHLLHIPRIGERIDGQKVIEVGYKLSTPIKEVAIELDKIDMTYVHLDHDEAQFHFNKSVYSVLGRSKEMNSLGQFKYPWRDVFHTKTPEIMGFKNREFFCDEDQFDEWFPHIEPLDNAQELESPKRKGFWKLFR